MRKNYKLYLVVIAKAALLMLFLLVMILAGIRYDSETMTAESPVPVLSGAVTEERETLDEDFSFGVRIVQDGIVETGANLQTHWWQNTDGNYFLFLPSFAPQEVQLRTVNVGEIVLDGQIVQHGDMVLLTDGQHSVSVAGSHSAIEFRVMRSANIGTIFLETDSGSMDYIHADKNNREAGLITVLDANGNAMYKGHMDRLNCRGNISFDSVEKKSYQVKLQSKADLFGMGKSRTWLLISDAFDPTMIRNFAVLGMAREGGIPYTPEMDYTDVYANGEYMGSYLITEKVELGKGRIEGASLEKETESLNAGADLGTFPQIADWGEWAKSLKGYDIPKNPVDITGTYLMELDLDYRYPDEPSGFITYRNQPVVIKSPEYASREQVNYAADLYEFFEEAIFAEDGLNPYTGEPFTAYIDLDSFARKYLLEEISKNQDASYTSQYFVKFPDEVSTKLFACSPWDYDKSLATPTTWMEVDLFEPDSFYANIRKSDSDLWWALYQHEEFREYVKKLYWEEFRDLTLQKAQEDIPKQVKKIEKSVLMDEYRWAYFEDATDDADMEKQYTFWLSRVQNFMIDRITFLDSEWAQ
ncbi:MAG: CotH kinase family protein [Lachnospiraceae bacterium]|nr:CotH kinase family protein [Lachnospiraceae bacterium]